MEINPNKRKLPHKTQVESPLYDSVSCSNCGSLLFTPIVYLYILNPKNAPGKTNSSRTTAVGYRCLKCDLVHQEFDTDIGDIDFDYKSLKER